MTVWEVLKNFKGYDGKFKIVDRNEKEVINEKIDFCDLQNVLDKGYWETLEEFNKYNDIADKNVVKINLELNIITID